MSRTPASTLDSGFRSNRDDVVRAVFYGLGADGTVGANKNSVKIIAEDAGLLRAGLFRLRFATSRAPRRSRICASGREPIRAPYLIARGAASSPATSSSFLDAIDVLRLAAPGADLPAQQPLWRRRRVGPSAALRAAADHRQETALLRHRRLEGRARRRGSAAAPTPYCKPAFSPSPACCRGRRRSRGSSTSIEKTYGRKGAERRRAEFRGRRRHAGASARSRDPERRRPAPSTGRRSSRRRRRSSCSQVTAEMMAGRGDELRSAPCRSTALSRPAPPPGRSAISPTRCRSGRPDLCIQCGQCGFVCPH